MHKLNNQNQEIRTTDGYFTAPGFLFVLSSESKYQSIGIFIEQYSFGHKFERQQQFPKVGHLRQK